MMKRIRVMRFLGVAFFLACAWWPILGAAQDAAEIDKIADTMVRLCLGGGRNEAVSGGGSGGADLSLRSLDVNGNVKGEFKISKSSAEGLVNGIDNALSQVAADQADKVRACLQPVRERLLDVMLPPKKQGATGQTVTAPGGVAVGGDVKGALAQAPTQPAFPAPVLPSITNPLGNCNNYGLNNGSITNNCPVINQAPTPEIQLLTSQFSNEKRPDGTFSHQILLKITGLSDLGVLVCGDGLKDLSAGPYPAGMAAVASVDAPSNCIKRRFYNVQGAWSINVITNAENNKFTVTPVLLP
jgi:hypothetical protein